VQVKYALLGSRVMDRSRLIAAAADLFRWHGLDVRGWRLEFKRFGHRLGSCCSRERIIALNDYYAENNNEPLIIDTLLHEIAHALVGSSHGHGPLWKAMARKLGCTPKACSKKGVLIRPGNYQATCPTCQRRFNKYRRPKYVVGYYCPSCGKERGRLVFAARSSMKEAASEAKRNVDETCSKKLI
jgi:predicted SprT family Zn-dependent metalloprotease